MDIGFQKEESFSFWKNIILVSFFFTVTPLVILTSLFSLVSLSNFSLTQNKLNSTANLIVAPKSGAKVFASLPSNIPSVSDSVTARDARPELIEQYLASYNSPLAEHADLIVQTADKYELDFRLITAIAQQESNVCRFIPPGSYNCWGWGIHSQGTLGFDSFEEGIETVSQGLREEYLNKGYTTIEEIMSKYTPLSNGSWAYGVNKFMSEME